MQKQDWKLLETKEVFDGPHGSRIENWKMSTHHGKEKDFTIRIGKDFIILFALTENKEVVVVHEYFPANQKRLASLVGGIVDPGETHRSTAEKELLEESGYTAKEFVHLGALSRGKYNSGIMHSYLAIDAKKIQEQNLEEEEDIEIEIMTIEKFRKFLAEGNIECVFEVATCYQALDYLGYL